MRGTLTDMKIGVFDSGIGGKIVAITLQQAFPNDVIQYVNDSAHMPYGTKTSAEIQALTLQAIFPLIHTGCQVIVVACNTATTNAIQLLRQTYPAIFFVGLEPMVKPAAAQTKTGVIGVCATPATLTSDGYQHLKDFWTKDIRVIEPDCSNWAELIEHGQAVNITLESTIRRLRDQQCDVIVLACTHYHWLYDQIRHLAPTITILEPTDAITRRINTFKQDYRSFTASMN